MSIAIAIVSIFFFSKALPVETACTVSGIIRTPKIVQAESRIDPSSKKLNLAVAIDETVDGENPRYVVVVLSENNIATTKFAAIYGNQSSAGQQIAPFELAKLTKSSSGNYVLPGIETKQLATFVVSVFGYKCDPSVSMNVSSLSVYQEAGVLDRQSSLDNAMSIFAYKFSNPGKGLIENPAPTSAKTVNGVVVFSKTACGAKCELDFNFSSFYSFAITPDPTKILKFPLSAADLSRVLSSSRPSDSTILFEHGGFYYFYFQFSEKNFPEGLSASLGKKDGAVAGVSVNSGLTTFSVPSTDLVFESSVDNLAKIIQAKTGIYDDVLSDANYLNSKFMAFLLLQANVVAFGGLGDVVSEFESLPSLLTLTTNDGRFFELWKNAISRNADILDEGFSNLESVSDFQVELTSGAYSRIVLLPTSISGKSAHFSAEKINISHSNNIALFFRNNKDAFYKIGGGQYQNTDPTWESVPSSQSGFTSYTFDRGSITWNNILSGGLWARPVEGNSIKDQDSDERHYSIIIKRIGVNVANARFTGNINSHALVKASNQLKKLYPKDVNFLQYLPDDYKFRLVSDETYSFLVDSKTLPGFISPKLKCSGACISDLHASLSGDQMNIQVPSLTQAASFQYWLSSDQKIESGKMKKSITKYVYDIPLAIFPSHQFVVTGYGGVGDKGEKSMEGLAELYAKSIASSGGKPEIIRIRPLFGNSLRDIQISETGTIAYKGYGASFLEVNKLMSSGTTKEISFFGHGSQFGLWLGKLEAGSHLGFFDGINADAVGSIPAFLGRLDPAAKVNLFQCYGSTYWVTSSGGGIAMIPYDPSKDYSTYGDPVAKRISEKWGVPVTGFNWTALVTTPFETPDGKFMYGLSSQKEGSYASSIASSARYNSSTSLIEYSLLQIPAEVSEYVIDPAISTTSAIRKKGTIPSELLLQVGSLPLSTSIDCLQGGSCAW